jgi:type III secretion protein V
MSAADALETYGLLTIGDGLVSQIPALLISTAAGLVVTRVSSEDESSSLGSDVAAQIFGDPRALTIASIFLLGLAIIPGLPAIPFLVLAVVFFVVSRRLKHRGARDEGAREAAVVQKEAARETQAKRAMVPVVVPVAVDLGSALADQLLDDQGGGPLLETAVPSLRDALFIDLGIALPGVRARRSAVLPPDAYAIAIQEVPVGGGTLPAERLLCLFDAPTLIALGVEASPTVDPATGATACLVPESARESLEAQGVPCLDASAAISHHLGRAVSLRAHDLVGLQECQAMLDQLERAYPALVRNVVPKPVSLILLTDVLRRLVEEGVSIRPLREILEALATYAPNEKDAMTLTELVRGSLKRQLTHQHAEGGVLSVHLLDPMIEEAVRDSIQRTATGAYLAMPPDMAKDVIEAVRRECFPGPGMVAVLLTQPDVRRFMRRLLEVELPDASVLSYQELAPEVTVQPLGRVSL